VNALLEAGEGARGPNKALERLRGPYLTEG